jgi:hypothetical protein
MAIRKFPAPAKGRQKHLPGAMNKTEQEYAKYLNLRVLAGEILWWVFEGVKLRLARKTFFTADFFVMNSATELEVHEVKGHWEDDARVKIKVAAELYPFRFIAVKKKPGGGWEFEEFKEN